MVQSLWMMRSSKTVCAAVREGGAGGSGSAPIVPGERRRCDVALQDLRRTLLSCERHQFYSSLVVSLAGVAGVPLAFLGRLTIEPAPALQALAVGGPDWSAGDAPSRPPMALPTSLPASVDPTRSELHMRDWLLASGWLPPVEPGEVVLRLLRGCDDVPIGVLGIDLGGPIAADSLHVRSTLEAFANLAERVLERDAAIATLRRDGSQLEAILGSAMDAIVVADENLRILRFNEASERMFQRSADEVIGQSLNLLVPAAARELRDQRLRGFGSSGATVRRDSRLGEVRGLRADGTGFPAELAISCVSSDMGPRFTVILRDLTGRDRAIGQIAVAQAGFGGQVEQSLVGIFVVQGQRFRYLNPYMVQLLGSERADELVDRVPLIELIVPAQRARITSALRDCLAGPRRSMREQIGMLRRDGGVIVVQLHGRTFELDGKPALVGVALDITERGRPPDSSPD